MKSPQMASFSIMTLAIQRACFCLIHLRHPEQLGEIFREERTMRRPALASTQVDTSALDAPHQVIQAITGE
jgi:hypothetical protein